MFLSIDNITTGNRVREDYGSEGDWKRFVASFLKFGQLQPIKVEKLSEPIDGKEYKVIAGDRRLKAIKELNADGKKIRGLEEGMVEASFTDPVPLHTKLMMEFAENNDRKDFDFIEKARFIRKFHETLSLEHGDTWTQELTAHSLNLSPASISQYLRVEEAVKQDEGVAKAHSLKSAVKRMKVNERIQERKDATPKESLARATAVLSLGDARELFTTIDDASFDLVNFDPPWGDDASHKAAENHEAFADDTGYADQLMAELFPHIFRVLKNDRFCVFWHRAWASQSLAKLAESFGFNLQFTRTPCIWYKPDKTADQNRVPEKQLIEAYETFFLLRKGDPIFHEKYTHNVFAFERVPLGQIIHPTEKPVDLCTALIKLCSVPGEHVLDPTAGSSAFLFAGLQAGRRARGFELSEKYHERGVVRLAEYLKNVTYK
jgi:ParB/RepB/Spo0J family partition protein